MRRIRLRYNAPVVLTFSLLALAGAKIPDHYQGRSLGPLLPKRATVSPWREEFFCEHLMHHGRIPKWEGVRAQRYVYARYFEQQPVFEFLHDLAPVNLDGPLADVEHLADLGVGVTGGQQRQDVELAAERVFPDTLRVLKHARRLAITTTEAAEQLADIEACREAALRYCRGVDRLDPEEMKSAYWEDAIDDHGNFVGNAWEFVDRVTATHAEFRWTMHATTNHQIDLADDGVTATGETDQAALPWTSANAMGRSWGIMPRSETS